MSFLGILSLFCVVQLHAGKEDKTSVSNQLNVFNKPADAAGYFVDGYPSPQLLTNSVLTMETNKTGLTQELKLEEQNIKKKAPNKKAELPQKGDIKCKEEKWQFIPYCMLMAPIEVVREFKDLVALRKDFIAKFNKLSEYERVERIKKGIMFCDETGLTHEAFAHLTDQERDKYFKEMDLVDGTID